MDVEVKDCWTCRHCTCDRVVVKGCTEWVSGRRYPLFNKQCDVCGGTKFPVSTIRTATASEMDDPTADHIDVDICTACAFQAMVTFLNTAPADQAAALMSTIKQARGL